MWNPSSFIRWQDWNKHECFLDVLRETVIESIEATTPEEWQKALETWVVGGERLSDYVVRMRGRVWLAENVNWQEIYSMLKQEADNVESK